MGSVIIYNILILSDKPTAGRPRRPLNPEGHAPHSDLPVCHRHLRSADTGVHVAVRTYVRTHNREAHDDRNAALSCHKHTDTADPPVKKHPRIMKISWFKYAPEIVFTRYRVIRYYTVCKYSLPPLSHTLCRKDDSHSRDQLRSSLGDELHEAVIVLRWNGSNCSKLG